MAGEIGASWKIPLSSIRNLFSISVSPSASSSMISVSSSSAAENLKLGKPRDGEELDGEAVLRRSLEIAENFKLECKTLSHARVHLHITYRSWGGWEVSKSVSIANSSIESH